MSGDKAVANAACRKPLSDRPPRSPYSALSIALQFVTSGPCRPISDYTDRPRPMGARIKCSECICSASSNGIDAYTRHGCCRASCCTSTVTIRRARGGMRQAVCTARPCERAASTVYRKLGALGYGYEQASLSRSRHGSTLQRLSARPLWAHLCTSLQTTAGGKAGRVVVCTARLRERRASTVSHISWALSSHYERALLTRWSHGATPCGHGVRPLSAAHATASAR